jgi:hypothetical protein
MANGSSRRSAAQADARPEGLARPLVAGGKDQHVARSRGTCPFPSGTSASRSQTFPGSARTGASPARPAPVRPGLAPVPLQQALVGRGLALVQPRLALIWLKPVFSFTNNLLISFYLNQCHRPWPSVVARRFSGAFPAPRIQVDMIATGLLHALWLVLPPSAQIATR